MDKNSIPLSTVITSANKHDVKAVTDVIDDAIIKRPSASASATATVFVSTTIQRMTRQQHLCLDRAYNSKPIEKEIIDRKYVPIYNIKEKENSKVNWCIK